jgi:hypothetical protein
MTVMYDKYTKLTNYLYRTRHPLHSACNSLEIEPLSLDMEKMSLVSCDWCSVWEYPKNMKKQKDSTMYCSICAEMHLYHYD